MVEAEAEPVLVPELTKPEAERVEAETVVVTAPGVQPPAGAWIWPSPIWVTMQAPLEAEATGADVVALELTGAEVAAELAGAEVALELAGTELAGAEVALVVTETTGTVATVVA